MKNDSKSQRPDGTKKEVDAESAFILCLHTVEATFSGGNASQLGPLSHQPAPQLFLPPHLYAIPYLFHVLVSDRLSTLGSGLELKPRLATSYT